MNSAYQPGGFVFRGWPLENKRSPPVIFNPVLAKLKDDLAALESPAELTSEMLDLAAEYILAVTKLQPAETYRHTDVQAVLQKLFEREPSSTKQTRFSPIPDISFTIRFLHHQVAVIMCEVKNYMGIRGDAIFQSAASFSKLTSEIKGKLSQTYGQLGPKTTYHFPVILLGCMGTLFQVYAAVFLESALVEKLFVRDVDSITDIPMLARVFSLLRRAHADLETEYSRFESTDIPAKDYRYFYPSPCRLIEGWFPSLQFWARVSVQDGLPRTDLACFPTEDSPTRYNVFLALLRNPPQGIASGPRGVEVAVKFTYSYCGDAHSYLAVRGLAPPLYYCSPIRGGLIMVVMKYVKGDTLRQLNAEAQASPDPSKFLKENDARRSALDALRILNEAGFVHGNIGPDKVLVEESGAVQLIGFDFSGRHLEDHYPAHLEGKHYWTTGKFRFRGGLMDIAHDNDVPPF